MTNRIKFFVWKRAGEFYAKWRLSGDVWSERVGPFDSRDEASKAAREEARKAEHAKEGK